MSEERPEGAALYPGRQKPEVPDAVLVVVRNVVSEKVQE